MTVDYDESGSAIGMSFALESGAFRLPVRVDGVREALRREHAALRYLTPEHAARVAWRIAKDWLEAQFALIDARLSTLNEVTFPYLLSDDGAQTVFEAYERRQIGR